MEKRKFPRVDLNNLPADIKRMIGASVVWPWNETTSVIDLSHNGAALAVPKSKNIAPGEELDLQFVIDGFPKFRVASSIARAGEHIVGIKFLAMDTAARMQFEKFLQSKLIGLSVRLVNPHFYGPSDNFTYWFHGPHDFNVFIWEQAGHVERAMVEMGEDVLLYDGGSFRAGQKGLDQASNQQTWRDNPDGNKMEDIHRALEILSQVQESKELLAPLVRLLVDAS